ncbi:MAG TPA: NAD(P)-dependent oxidoreductase [Mycobacterium sp.]|nr:NAD(P)-dependent oxidoreductase [Mycobacterium sp.]
MRIAVLGTGIMGAGMARSLRREGHDVVAWNRTAAKAEPLAKDGIEVAESVTEAVTGADAVITMLFDADATLAIADDLLAALGPDAVWIQSGTVGPDGAHRIALAGGDRVLDVPVLGTKKPAEEGALVVLASGPQELIDKVQPVLDAIGGRTIVVGPSIGAASALKLACNAWVGLITAGTAQSLAFAQSLGVEPSLFLRAIEGGPVDSAYAQLKGKAMLAGSYDPSFALDGVVKDLSLMVTAANGVDFPAELIETVRAVFERASAQGHGEEDMAAVRYAFPS